MAFIKTSDSIVIKATLTDEGKKLLSRGKLKISKFAFGDDEIDYSLIDPDEFETSTTYLPAVENTKLLESYSDHQKNIQFGLMSYDSGFINLKPSELATQLERGSNFHANLMYLPRLKNNNLLDITPTVTGSLIYLSVNDETTKTLNKISDFKFLTTNKFENCKIVVESGISNVDTEVIEVDHEYRYPTKKAREELILKKYLLDSEMEILVDDRFIRNIVSISQNSKFENFESGETKIKLTSDNNPVYPLSLPNEFPNHATYIVRTIPNLLYDWPGTIDSATKVSTLYSVHDGARGSVAGFNLSIDDEMKINSESTTNFKFTKYGTTDKIIFSELPSSKFDYIDTTIYVIGSTTNARLSIPLRIVRYAGT